MFAMMLALLANNLGLLWVAVKAPPSTTVLMVGLYRTPQAIEAAWKYFILCGVGIALALFGTILIYLAAQPVMGEGLAAMTWSDMMDGCAASARHCSNLAFVFILVGYGTKVGLVPLHAWLPDAHAEGPTPISAVLSGLLLNVALYAVLRFKMLMAANPRRHGAGAADDRDGAAVAAARCLHAVPAARHQTPVRLQLDRAHGDHHLRLRHGRPGRQLRGPAAHDDAQPDQVGDLRRGRPVAQIKGTQQISEIRGLTSSHPAIGWGLVVGVLAIAGLPPFGIFLSEFLLVTSTFARDPFLALPLVLGIVVAFGALILRLQRLAFGPGGGDEPVRGQLPPAGRST